MTGCDFCRSRRLPWSKHSIEACHEIAKKQCTYCKEFGHTNYSCPKSLLKKQKEEAWNKREEEKRARWEANEKVRKEEKAKQEVAKANSWAAKATKSIPSDVAAKIAEENRILAEQSEKKRAAEAAERKRIWENKHSMRMMTKYGLKKDFIMPDKLKIYPRYEFWYFEIEGTQDDKDRISEVAKKMRDDPTNRENFHAYLKEQYFVNWIYASEDTEDDCKYLRDLRYQKACDEEYAYYNQERLWVKEIEAERNEAKREKKDMYEGVKSGRISQKVYDDWRISKHQEELEREEEFHNEGLRIWKAEDQMALAEAQWKARKELKNKNCFVICNL
uniref:CCHC-type domain-containing protein n=1 Tax=viral metagenome TaxID=1070528 RepID=A0A6C0EQG0_9ZZZZ